MNVSILSSIMNAPIDPCQTVPLHAVPAAGRLDAAACADFAHDGMLLRRGYFSRAEMDALLSYARNDAPLQQNANVMKDAAGRASRLNLWTTLRDDLYARFSRCRRVAGAAAQLLGEEVYHWHAKMMLKEPKVGGAWEWHQDYGYWYNDKCLSPQMISCMVAVDRATRANGCLQVLRGSHRFGRIDHGKFGDQVGADPARVAAARSRCELVHFEAEPGDAIFFHGNLLHGSEANTSDHSRWSLIMTYNARSNSPFVGGGFHPEYSPLPILDDDLLLG